MGLKFCLNTVCDSRSFVSSTASIANYVASRNGFLTWNSAYLASSEIFYKILLSVSFEIDLCNRLCAQCQLRTSRFKILFKHRSPFPQLDWIQKNCKSNCFDCKLRGVMDRIFKMKFCVLSEFSKFSQNITFSIFWDCTV